MRYQVWILNCYTVASSAGIPMIILADTILPHLGMYLASILWLTPQIWYPIQSLVRRAISHPHRETCKSCSAIISYWPLVCGQGTVWAVCEAGALSVVLHLHPTQRCEGWAYGSLKASFKHQSRHQSSFKIFVKYVCTVNNTALHFQDCFKTYSKVDLNLLINISQIWQKLLFLEQ